MKSLIHVAAMACLLLVGITGCGGASGAKVSGKVTVAGQPVANIRVMFQPEAGGRPAIGVTDASGGFSLSKADGAVPGKHKVSFGMESTGATPPTIPFNAKYRNPETSGITAEVVAGKANELPAWDLEK